MHQHTNGSVPSSVGTSSGESDSELRYISKDLVQVISELRREQCRHQLAKKRKETAAVAGTSATTDPGASTSSSDPGTSTSTRYRNSSRSSAAAAHSGTSEDNTTINSNVCCVCYRTFEEDQLEGNGLEWVQCVWEVAT